VNYKYRCIDCGTEYSHKNLQYLCKKCSSENSSKTFQKGILKTIIDTSFLQSLKNKKNVIPDDFQVYNLNDFPVGNTPLISSAILSKKTGFRSLYLKNDGLNPSGSLKDRASYLIAAQTSELGEKRIVLASTGNAGSAMACIGAAVGLEVILFVPETAPKAKLLQSILYGAKVIPVKGTYDDAYKLSIEFTSKYGGINRNTGYNPLTIEGKKTVSIEIFNQLSRFAPDYVYVPVGDGVIYSGVCKGFEDLYISGLIEKVPQIIGVQSNGSNAIYRAIQSGSLNILEKANTIADSISVQSPSCGRMVINYAKQYNGWMTEVSDNEILDAQIQLCKDSGIFVEPAAAASWAGFLKNSKKLDKNSVVVILLTGTGFKDIEAVEKSVKIPKSINPKLSEVEKVLMNG